MKFFIITPISCIIAIILDAIRQLFTDTIHDGTNFYIVRQLSVRIFLFFVLIYVIYQTIKVTISALKDINKSL